MSSIRSTLLIVAVVLVGGCGGGGSVAASAPSSSAQAEVALEHALTQVGLTVCRREGGPVISGELTATVFLGPCGPTEQGAVRFSGFRSAAARAAGLKALARPSEPWTQGWAWDAYAVVVSEKTPPDQVLVLATALKRLQATMVFEQ